MSDTRFFNVGFKAVMGAMRKVELLVILLAHHSY